MDTLENKNTNANLKESLSKELWFGATLYLYQGFWCPHGYLDPVIAFQAQFEAHDTDIILASLPKTGTTWLKSLLYTTVNRQDLSSISQHTLNSLNPHELVKHFEIQVYNQDYNKCEPNLTDLPSPRLFSTHIPYTSLPDSIKTSKCRIVYVCRNPLDTFVSLWNFFLNFNENRATKPDMKMMEELVGKYCMGLSPYGPYDDHLLSYWNESKKNPQKVLFLEYEGLKIDPKGQLKRLAEFVGCPFTKEEEESNVIDEIIEICSLKSLKEKDINKNGNVFAKFENKHYFRKGEIGDWKNYLSPLMAKQFDQMIQKLKDAGFSSAYYPMNV